MRDYLDCVALAVIGVVTGALLGGVGLQHGLTVLVMVLALFSGGITAVIVHLARRRRR